MDRFKLILELETIDSSDIEYLIREVKRLRHLESCLGCPDCKGIVADQPCGDDYIETPPNHCGRCGCTPTAHIAWTRERLRERITELNDVNKLRAAALRRLVQYCLDSRKVLEEHARAKGKTDFGPVAIGALDALQVIGFLDWDEAIDALKTPEDT